MVPVKVSVLTIVDIEAIYILIVRPTATTASLTIIFLLDVMRWCGFLELCHVGLRTQSRREQGFDIGRLSYQNLSHRSSNSERNTVALDVKMV